MTARKREQNIVQKDMIEKDMIEKDLIKKDMTETDITEAVHGTTPAATEDVVEKMAEGTTLTYKMSDLTHWHSYFLDYEYMDGGSVFVRYDEVYAELMLRFPEEIDMSKCIRVEATVKSEAGKLAIKLYDNAFNEMDVQYGIKTIGMQNKVSIML